MFRALFYVSAVGSSHVVRLVDTATVDNSSVAFRFGPQRQEYDCEMNTTQQDIRMLAIKSRWALLNRHCKSFKTNTQDRWNRWNYNLCFGGLLMKYQYGGHARISLGQYEERMDTYTDDYFVQHYINGSPIFGANIKTNHTAEVRCYCGDGEPRILSVDYNNHSIISVEMPPCCQNVEIKPVFNVLPSALSFDQNRGHSDVRFSKISTLKVEFSSRNLTVVNSSNEEEVLNVGEPRFIPAIPKIAFGVKPPRPTLKRDLRPALYFPLSRLSIKENESVTDKIPDDIKEELEQAKQRAEKATLANNSSTDESMKVVGGIFCMCPDNWNTVFTDKLVNLVQSNYIGILNAEVYVILESVAFCAFHQLLPFSNGDSAMQCRARKR